MHQHFVCKYVIIIRYERCSRAHFTWHQRHTLRANNIKRDHTTTGRDGGATRLGLLIVISWRCLFRRLLFHKFRRKVYRVRRRRRWLMTVPYTAVSVSVPPPAVVRCIVDDMWRRGCGRIDWINQLQWRWSFIFAIIVHMMCVCCGCAARWIGAAITTSRCRTTMRRHWCHCNDD